MMQTDLHQAALAAARAGRPEAALEHFDAYLKERPDNGFVWNDAGVVLYSQGRFEAALPYFRRAVALDNRPPRAFRNLAQTYLSLGQPWRAMQVYETLRREGLLDAGLIRRIADAFSAQGDAASAMDVLQRGRGHLPEAAELEAPIESLRDRRAKIAFFWGGDGPTFLNDILDYARQRYTVRTFAGKTAQDMHALMRWSDISWFEWCTDLVVMASKMPKVCRTIVRLHRFESYQHWPASIDWSRIDLLMTVGNRFIRQALERQVPDIQSRTALVTIPNGVDLGKFAFRPRQPGKKIVFLGHLRMIKNPGLALQCLKALTAIDPGYTLHFAGWWQDYALEQYLRHMVQTLGLDGAVHFDGYQSDVQGYLDDKQYIVSTSLTESQGMGLLEAMACGIKPVIHHFPGAEEIFGRRYLFATPADFCRLICEPSYDSASYRAFVERRYPLSQQLLQINELFAMFERSPWSEASSAPGAGLCRLPV